jgi:hypothetical protein
MKNIMAISLLALAAFAFNGNVCAQTEQKGQSVKIVKASDPQITYSGRVLFHSSGNVQSAGSMQSGNKKTPAAFLLTGPAFMQLSSLQEVIAQCSFQIPDVITIMSSLTAC